MNRKKVFIRLLMVIFIFGFPIYQGIQITRGYLEIKSEEKIEKDKVTEELKGYFLIRDKSFYKSQSYERQYKELVEDYKKRG